MFKALTKLVKKLLGLVKRENITYKFTQEHIKHVLESILEDHYDNCYSFGNSYIVIHYSDGYAKLDTKDPNMSEEVVDLINEILSNHQADSSF